MPLAQAQATTPNAPRAANPRANPRGTDAQRAAARSRAPAKGRLDRKTRAHGVLAVGSTI
jgi:hypothetical protein